LRTDLEGLITVRTDGQRISFETFRSRAASHTRSVCGGWLV
jgi:hypothetical protein